MPTVWTWRIITNMTAGARNRRPTHPGALLREDILPAAGLTQTALATCLGVSRRTVSQLIHELRPVSTDIAHRLAKVFGTTPESWLRMQEAVDLWEALESNREIYARLKDVRGKTLRR